MWTALATLGVTTAAAPHAAAQAPAYGRGGVELNAWGGVLDAEAPDGVVPATEIERDAAFGGRLSWLSGAGPFVGAEVGFSRQTLSVLGGPLDLDALRYAGVLGVNLQLARPAQLFLAGGAGAFRWEPEGLPAETDFSFHFGGGLRLFVTPNLAIRADVRDHVIPDALGETHTRLGLALSGDETTHNLEYGAGLSLFLGGERDSDRDGVRDGTDRCPGTPRGAPVDAAGCPRDADGDRVPDHEDRCSGTPAGAAVDADGCPVDGDGDGVPDGLDGCADTPAGATVDAQGCPVDGDADGVLDGLDRCPDTPAGATVDAAGCPRDADDDGVLDGLDRCPGSPEGAEVDDEGCSRVEAGIEAGRLVLEDVHFDFGKATVRPDSRALLDEVGRALVARPELSIEIQGHTDAIGSEAANRELSLRRARAVLETLLAAFPDLDRSRFTVTGYGESRPVDTNDTEEGRQRNRRVEFVAAGDGADE